MDGMIRRVLGGLIVFAAVGAYANEPMVVDVWPGKVPGEAADVGPEKWQEQKPNEKQVKRLPGAAGRRAR